MGFFFFGLVRLLVLALFLYFSGALVVGFAVLVPLAEPVPALFLSSLGLFVLSLILFAFSSPLRLLAFAGFVLCAAVGHGVVRAPSSEVERALEHFSFHPGVAVVTGRFDEPLKAIGD